FFELRDHLALSHCNRSCHRVALLLSSSIIEVTGYRGPRGKNGEFWQFIAARFAPQRIDTPSLNVPAIVTAVCSMNSLRSLRAVIAAETVEPTALSVLTNLTHLELPWHFVVKWSYEWLPALMLSSLTVPFMDMKRHARLLPVTLTALTTTA